MVPVAGRVEKMSKSKKNTVDPEPILDRYGADAVRWFMLSDSPPERDLEWSIGGIEGAARFVQRVWRLATAPSGNAGEDDALNRKLHRAIAAVGEAIDGLQFNKSVAALYELTNAIEKAKPSGDPRRGDPHPAAAGRARRAASGRGSVGRAWRERHDRRRRLAGARSGPAGRRDGDAGGPGQRQVARYASRRRAGSPGTRPRRWRCNRPRCRRSWRGRPRAR